MHKWVHTNHQPVSTSVLMNEPTSVLTPPNINTFHYQLIIWSWLIFSKFLITKFIAQPSTISPSAWLYCHPWASHPFPSSGASQSGQLLGCLVSLVPATGVVRLCLELTVAGLTHPHRLQDAKTADLRLKATAPVGWMTHLTISVSSRLHLLDEWHT